MFLEVGRVRGYDWCGESFFSRWRIKGVLRGYSFFIKFVVVFGVKCFLFEWIVGF